MRASRKLVDTGISPINIISPICFHIKCVGNSNDNISSEVHFETSKSSRDS
jgi:hypothetical protein